MPRRLTIPDVLSLARLVGTPALFPLVRLESPAPFLAWYGLLALTDFLDGRLARAWGQTSHVGAMLDSVADLAFYIATAALLWIRFPQYVRPNLPLVVACLGLLAVQVAYTRVRFGRVLLPHTHLSRAAGVLAVAVAVAAFLTDATLLIRVVVLVYTAAFVEQMLMFLLHGPVDLDTRSLLQLRLPRRDA